MSKRYLLVGVLPGVNTKEGLKLADDGVLVLLKGQPFASFCNM